MGTFANQHAWPHIMLRAWIMIWMLAVPLFHVHPEADQHHGEAGHIHGGTVHTVFSPDLDGEFTSPRNTAATAEIRPTNQVAVFSHRSHASDYAELGFSFVSDSTDRSLPKPVVTAMFLVEPPAHLVLTAKHSVNVDQPRSQSVALFTRDIPSRAPPSPFV